ncbi:tRNA (adenine(58)-N(1))-methyltransferase non-catalytic subunit TRM6-like [Paramacrobiotus metropolitanus]|uniref:tRNA (adenine(58)-N(1))-methyltransferase non-catalytic subunit TRM6-like n=1 Tax=Paramacrobiotus metropolitanus TaxID=2943436 RepID=UPI002445B541|nr:tRNA (adenine(58)-N(1))-methyltransferase non-catalytic subunit TRM6-like [Paramacrobiotus metropolitanus]
MDATHSNAATAVSRIADGARVIFQRKDWSKECVVGSGKFLMISKMKTRTDEIVGLPYGCLVEWNKQEGVFQRVDKDDDEDDIEDYGEEDGDNRNLVDDGSAQSLTLGEISALKSSGVTGMELIGNLVKNSSTFGQRQEYSKEKYVQKKKDKHIYRFRVLQPTLRLVCEVYNCQRSQKINHLRVDTLAMMLSFANIRHGSNVVVVDGSQGILLAAALQRTGGAGRIVHIHSGPQPVIPAFDMFGFDEEWLKSIHHLSVDNLEVLSSNVRILSSSVVPAAEPEPSPPFKRRKLSDPQAEAVRFIQNTPMDSLIMSTRLHPKSILLFLLPFLRLSGNFAVHHAYREVLVDTFNALRTLGSCVRICLNETWLRYYQVLPDRTHPENNMNGSGGYLLSGTVVERDAVGDKSANLDALMEDLVQI